MRSLLHSLLTLAVIGPTLDAQGTGFERRELTIPMRDGTKLFAVALVPTGATAPLPIMLIRTPYSAARAFPTDTLPASYSELAQDGYIFVTEDIRGRYRSEGLFIMNRAQHDPRDHGTNESTDTYDTVDWLLKNLPNNSGKVGVMGISYPGWLAGVAGVDPHPAIKAISPQAPMTDTWMGDDFFHQGAFRQSFGVEYASYMEFTKDGTKSVPIDRYDRYDWYLQYPTLSSVAAATGIADIPSWVGFRTHPAWDAYWQGKAMELVMTKPAVPLLFVGGFWDQEDIYGPQGAYRAIEAHDTRDINRIVLGPWYHGEWSRPGAGDSIGAIRFGSKTSDYFREHIQRPWFAYYLHGTGDGKFPEAWVFESGENAWHTFDAWPPKTAQNRSIYLREHGELSFDPPKTPGYESYVSDPAHPIPYMPRPIDGTRWHGWLLEDQRFVEHRPDVLSWQTPPLTEDVTIAGDVTAHLCASTTGTDADWVVKLIDVYPDSVQDAPRMGGYELMVAEDIMRGRYRTSFEHPSPIPANAVEPFTVDLHEQLYRFLKGHRIMVQVQSTWYPLYDRNPQTYVANIFDAQPTDFHAREHRVYHTVQCPSRISFGVLPH
jgi:putative CocE/NonD family hydrolase